MSSILPRLSIIVVTIIALQCNSFKLFAQDENVNPPFSGYLYLQPNVGISQYFGDLNKDDLWNNDRKLGYGLIAGYQLSPIFGIRGQFLKTELYSERSDQNKRFTSDLWDGALNLTINVNEIFAKYNEKRFINFYLFTGGGITSYKSKIQDFTTGELIIEHTERQKEFFLPVGAGVSFRMNSAISVNLEYSDHMTFKGDNLDFSDQVKKNDHYSYFSAGLQINIRAKDTDRDGIKDKKDMCPLEPGKVELAGCPDKDNDGIADKDDACPDAAGTPAFKGCPDTDGDGIVDKDDACPAVAGKKELAGCPDKDSDGIADISDKCPDAFGKKEFNGCPDRDGDAVIDIDDLCPDVKGLSQFGGCPDTDGDGIPNNKDNCPEVKGIASNNGCPEALKGAVMQKTVYFNTDGSVVVLAQNILDMNEIAAYMNENPDAVISVSGYADARESVDYNLRLSEKRADYVINYLKKKGMKTTAIEKAFFGKNNPVGDNSTIEGRKLNRRVEIKIKK